MVRTVHSVSRSHVRAAERSVNFDRRAVMTLS